jgi:hypothetical protein
MLSASIESFAPMCAEDVRAQHERSHDPGPVLQLDRAVGEFGRVDTESEARLRSLRGIHVDLGQLATAHSYVAVSARHPHGHAAHAVLGVECREDLEVAVISGNREDSAVSAPFHVDRMARRVAEGLHRPITDEDRVPDRCGTAVVHGRMVHGLLNRVEDRADLNACGVMHAVRGCVGRRGTKENRGAHHERDAPLHHTH